MYQRTVQDFQDILTERQQLQIEYNNWQQRWDSLIKLRYELLKQLETQTDSLTKKELAGLKARLDKSDKNGRTLQTEMEMLNKRASALADSQRINMAKILRLCDSYLDTITPSNGPAH